MLTDKVTLVESGRLERRCTSRNMAQEKKGGSIMSAHMPSKNDVQDSAKFALLVAVVGPASWALFTIKGLIALRGLLALESLLLFLVIGVVTVALTILSLSLRRAAHRLPPTRLSAETA